MEKLLTGGEQDLEAEDKFAKQAMDHGKKFESQASQVFLSRFGHQYLPLGDVRTQYSHLLDVLCHDTNKTVFTIGATPDLLLTSRACVDLSLLEIKCPYRDWLSQRDITPEEEAWSLLSPKHYSQCQMQMLVLGVRQSLLFFYIPKANADPSENYACFSVEADPLFQDYMLANVYLVYEELKQNAVSRYKTIRNEGAHNRCVISESRKQHCKFLIG